VKLQNAIVRCAFSNLALLLLAHAAPAATQAHLIVGNDKTTCPRAQFDSIQNAVNAASPGDEISICNGIYKEQVTINKALDIDADTGAFLVPNTMHQNATSFSGTPIAAAIVVMDAMNVSITGLTVDGINNAIEQCSPRLIGVFFRNASGELKQTAIRNFKLSGSTTNGCQSGTGIFVESGSGGVSTVTIANCSIHDFQKNGITANETGTTVQIQSNVITGLGPVTGAAQNGIQIGFNAGGSIAGNTVTNNVWSPCTSTTNCAAVGTNILVVQSDKVMVTRNHVGIAQIPIFVVGNHAMVTSNTAFDAKVFENIRLEGSANTVTMNRVYDGGEADIFLHGNNNDIEHNLIFEAPIGILKATGSTGNIIANNEFFNVAVKVQDPITGDLAGRIQPER
jgi:nitrous oxidase accessory protein NosD